MTFAKRLRFYLIGVGLGLVVVLIFFGPRAISCSYFPNDRVIDEAKSKGIQLSDKAKNWLQSSTKSEEFLTDTLLQHAEILNFGTEEARREPCGLYHAKNTKEGLNFSFEICRDKAVVISVESFEK